MTSEDKIEESINGIKLSDLDLFTKIWTSPRLVFKYINDNSYSKYEIALLVTAGILKTFDNTLESDLSLVEKIAVSIIGGGLLGWVGYYIYAALLSWTGKWLKGKGNTQSLLRIVAHAMIPSIIALLLNPIILLGRFYIQGNVFVNIAYVMIHLLQAILSLWSVAIFVIGISEVQKFSIGKSILNMIIPGLIMAVPILIILLIIDFFGSGIF